MRLIVFLIQICSYYHQKLGRGYFVIIASRGLIKLFLFLLSNPSMSSLGGSQLREDSNLPVQQGQYNICSMSDCIVRNAIQYLLQITQEHIKNKQLLTILPKYAQIDFIDILEKFLYQLTPNYGTLHPSGLEQDDVSKIIKIPKDNLSPKQLPSENPQKDHTFMDLPQNLLSMTSRRLSFTNRSTKLRRKESQISGLVTGATTQRVSLEKKTSIMTNDRVSQSKVSKSHSYKKDPLRNFKSILVHDNEDPEIGHLREKVVFQHKERQREHSVHLERIRQQEAKLESFRSQFGVSGNFTFGFDGEPLVSESVDDKLSYYAMRVGVKTSGRKLRSIYKHLEGIQSEQRSVANNKSFRTREPLSETLDLQKSTADIPTFPKQIKTFRQSIQPKEMRIDEYKKLYGRKFSRYDKSLYTIDLQKTMDGKRTDDEEEYFTSRRHLTDSKSVNKSRGSSVNREFVANKLALPRLQGKYKLLDRYDGL